MTCVTAQLLRHCSENAILRKCNRMPSIGFKHGSSKSTMPHTKSCKRKMRKWNRREFAMKNERLMPYERKRLTKYHVSWEKGGFTKEVITRTTCQTRGSSRGGNETQAKGKWCLAARDKARGKTYFEATKRRTLKGTCFHGGRVLCQAKWGKQQCLQRWKRR